MESYRKLSKLGEGAHGVVYCAEVVCDELKRRLKMPDTVAIKKIRLGSAEDGLSMEAIREIKILQVSVLC
jgi:serine/threonine protein kinase